MSPVLTDKSCLHRLFIVFPRIKKKSKKKKKQRDLLKTKATELWNPRKRKTKSFTLTETISGEKHKKSIKNAVIQWARSKEHTASWLKGWKRTISLQWAEIESGLGIIFKSSLSVSLLISLCWRLSNEYKSISVSSSSLRQVFRYECFSQDGHTASKRWFDEKRRIDVDWSSRRYVKR